MALRPDVAPPAALLDTQGRMLSSVLLEHARNFTMQYLHHTIHGTPLDQEFVEGGFLGKRGKPSAVPHHPSELIERATRDERNQYGHLPGDRSKLKVSTQEGHASDYLEKYFTDHYLPAREVGRYKDIFDAQRAAVMMVMDRVLDSVQSRHADDFADAQNELTKVVAVSIRIIHPQLIEAGLQTHQAQRLMEHMYDEAIAQAIRNRVDGMNAAEEEAFWRDYDSARTSYRTAETEQNEPGLWHRQEQKGEGDTRPLKAPTVPYRARVRLRGEELLDRGHRAILMTGNDNEPRGR